MADEKPPKTIKIKRVRKCERCEKPIRWKADLCFDCTAIVNGGDDGATRGRPETRTGPWENSLKWALWKRDVTMTEVERICGGSPTHTTISRICSGEIIPSVETAHRIAKALGMTIDEAFYTRQNIAEEKARDVGER